MFWSRSLKREIYPEGASSCSSNDPLSKQKLLLLLFLLNKCEYKLNPRKVRCRENKWIKENEWWERLRKWIRESERKRLRERRTESQNKQERLGSGCGSVLIEVTSNTRGVRFESSHRQIFYWTFIYCIGRRKKEKKKEVRNRFF